MNSKPFYMLAAVLAFAATVAAQSADDSAGATAKPTYEQAAGAMQQRLDQSVEQLNELRRRIQEEQLPLSRKLNELENQLLEVRGDFQKSSRLLDTRRLDVSNLTRQIQQYDQQATYLSNLLGDYIRNLEPRLHIAELQRYRDQLEAAKLAPENDNLTDAQVYQAQAEFVAESLRRLQELLGGVRFEGHAVAADGRITQGRFLLLGPTAIFTSEDGQTVGVVEQQLGSLEPSVISYQDPADIAAAKVAVAGATDGQLPLDPTLGNAHKIEQTEETLIEHVQKGGPVMIPIFVLAGAALLVALYKWIALSFVRKPSRKRIDDLLEAVGRRDQEAAQRRAKAIAGPVGDMLEAGVEHLKEPRDLIEEIMFEKVLSARLKLQRFLPFIAICAAAAPLLGLLGTVTGIINTFTLITVFGTGDVKTLSGGISEALITTEFGLIVAIPSLLLHAFLARKAKGIVDQMEKAAVAMLNQISKTENRPLDKAA